MTQAQRFIAPAAILVLVGMTYGVALWGGRWPMSHPWSGISLVLLAITLATGQVGQSRYGPWFGGLAFLSSVLWFVSAVMD